MSQYTLNFSKDFNPAIRTKFISFVHSGRAMDKLRTLVQHSRVAKYLNEFQNLDLTIPYKYHKKKLDNFCVISNPSEIGSSESRS